uniref:ParB-like N-terminal domain-containing protein n=1 Tax=viral metagenome TaxID=1070528 RepID=A0A6M3LF12_9ZZZZ
MEQEFKHIPSELIDPPKNPVRVSTSETSIQELAESIKTHGLWQPITVFPVNGRYETLIGDRRQLACKLAGLSEIPCIVVDDAGTLSQVIRLTENIQRVDMSPVEEGAIIRELQELNNWGYKLLSAHLSKSIQWVRTRLYLMDLSPDLQILVHNKQLGVSHALLLGRITDETTRKRYTSEVLSQGTGMKTVELWVQLWEHAQQSPTADIISPEDPSTLPQSLPHKIRCQLCEQYYPVHNMISVVTCRDCVKILQEAKNASSSVSPNPDPYGGDSNIGMGDPDGAKANQA